MQLGVVREILAHRLVHAIEFALDDALLGFAAGREQYVAVAQVQVMPAFGNHCRRYPEGPGQGPRASTNRVMGGASGEIQRRHSEYDP